MKMLLILNIRSTHEIISLAKNTKVYNENDMFLPNPIIVLYHVHGSCCKEFQFINNSNNILSLNQ